MSMKVLVCLARGHVYRQQMRLMVLDDAWPPTYTGGKRYRCTRCGWETDVTQPGDLDAPQKADESRQERAT